MTMTNMDIAREVARYTGEQFEEVITPLWRYDDEDRVVHFPNANASRIYHNALAVALQERCALVERAFAATAAIKSAIRDAL